MFYQKDTLNNNFLHLISTFVYIIYLYGYLNINYYKFSEIRATISGLQSQIKEALDIKNIELSHQTDKSGENQDQGRQRETNRGKLQIVR